MALLSASQQQSYLNLLNQASLRPKTREVLERGIRNPKSIEMLNDFCSRATKIDIAIFQAITNPVKAAPAPAPTPDPVATIEVLKTQTTTTPTPHARKKFNLSRKSEDIEFKLDSDAEEAPAPVVKEKEVVQPVVEVPVVEQTPVVKVPVVEQTPVVEVPVVEQTPVVEVPAAIPHIRKKFDFSKKVAAEEAPVVEQTPIVEAPAAKPAIPHVTKTFNFSKKTKKAVDLKPSPEPEKNPLEVENLTIKQTEAAVEEVINIAEQKPDVKVEKPALAHKKQAMSFYTCNDDEVKREEAAVINKGYKGDVQKAIEACKVWAPTNGDLYLYYKDNCEAAIDVTVATAICYANIIPKNIVPETGSPVYACYDNDAQNIFKPDANAFTYLYNSEEGKLQHLRNCANWIADNSEYALSLNGQTCMKYQDAEKALTACVDLA